MTRSTAHPGRTVVWLGRGEEGGGVARSLLSVSEAFDSIELRVAVVTLQAGSLVDFAENHDLPCLVASCPSWLVALRQSVPSRFQTPSSLLLDATRSFTRSVENAARTVAREGVASVHVRSPTLLSIGGQLARRLDCPLVWQIGNAPGEPGRSNSVRRFIYRWAIRTSGARPLANSRFIAEKYAFLGPVSWAYVPIESRFFESESWPEAPEPLRFLSLGRIHPMKGQMILVDAFERYLAGGHRWHLEIVGLQPGEPESEVLRHRVQDSPARQQITLTGFQADPLPAFLRNHVVVSGHTRAESFGQVAAQAIALGRPVIAIGMGGPAELVARSEYGWRVDRFESAQVATGMAVACKEYADLSRGSDDARAFAREEFCPKAFATQYLRMIAPGIRT